MRLFFIACLFLAVASSAHAACLHSVSSIALIENGPPVHVSLHDQTCNQITPGAPTQFSVVGAGLSNCSATLVGMAGAIPAPTKVVATPDTTGVSLQAVPAATGMSACTIAVQFTDGSLVVSNNLSISLSSGVTAVNLTSP